MITQKTPGYIIPSALNRLVSRLCFPAACLALLGACLLHPLQASADTPANGGPPAATPVDKEQDLQNKLQLQEKISRELEENRKRIVEKSEKKSDRYTPKNPPLTSPRNHKNTTPDSADPE